MTCRDDVLFTAQQFVADTGMSEFTIQDIIDRMTKMNTRYKESTIRTHITARMCHNAPKNHAVVFDDFERIGFGLYKLRNK